MIFQLARQGATVPGSVNPEDADYTAAWRTVFKSPVNLPAGSVVTLQGAAIASALDTALPITIDEDITMNCKFLVWATIINNKGVCFSTVYPPSIAPFQRDEAGQSYKPAFLCGPPVPSADNPQGGGYVETETSFVVPAGSYTLAGLCERVTQASRELIATTGHSGQKASPFSIMFDYPQDVVNGERGNAKYWLLYEGLAEIAAVMDFFGGAATGASNICLLGSPYGLVVSYDDDVGKVELQYAHLPCQNGSGDEVAYIEPLYSNGVKETDQHELVADRTGIVLTDVGFGYEGQPAWDSANNIFAVLGFTFDDLMVSGGLPEIVATPLQPYECPSFTRTLRVGNLLPTSGDVPTNRCGAGTTAGENVATTGQQGVQASRPPRSFGITQAPLYLVECDLLPEALFWCADGYRRRIIGYVTRELESGGYLYTSLSDEVVLSKAVLVSNIGIRLLDPNNGFQVVEGLGLTSFVHLGISTPGGVSPDTA